VFCVMKASDVTIATALLTSGVECYSDDWLEALDLLKVIRGLEDRMAAARDG
jgi:hypothetical protein